MTTPTHSQPSETAKQKRAKARVMFDYRVHDNGTYSDTFFYRSQRGKTVHKNTHHQLIAVLPTATRKQAQQIVRWANLSRDQKVEAIAKETWRLGWGAKFRDSLKTLWAMKSAEERKPYLDDATAILNLISPQ